jgi:hypothetical protein
MYQMTYDNHNRESNPKSKKCAGYEAQKCRSRDAEALQAVYATCRWGRGREREREREREIAMISSTYKDTLQELLLYLSGSLSFMRSIQDIRNAECKQHRVVVRRSVQ